MQQRLVRDFGHPVYTQAVGLTIAQVHEWRGRYYLFLVEDCQISLVGTSTSIAACKRKVRELKYTAEYQTHAEQAKPLVEGTRPVAGD